MASVLVEEFNSEVKYKGYQYNLFPGDFLIFEYNEFIDGFHFICVERGKDSLKK